MVVDDGGAGTPRWRVAASPLPDEVAILCHSAAGTDNTDDLSGAPTRLSRVGQGPKHPLGRRPPLSVNCLFVMYQCQDGASLS